MGYTTDFSGVFTLDRQLSDAQHVYLKKFSKSRRMMRSAAHVALMPDTYREAVGLPVGTDGEFYVASADDGHFGQSHDASIIDYNLEPRTQPGLWCKWEPTKDGMGIQWSGAEKFYDYEIWLAYLCRNFLTPWGFKVGGKVEYQGEEIGDYGTLDGAYIQEHADEILARIHHYGNHDDIQRKWKAKNPDPVSDISIPSTARAALQK